MIKVIESKGKTLISVSGIQRIDHSNVSRLSSEIDFYIRKNHEIILNLNKVFFIDTEGFKTLLSLSQKADNIGGKIRLMQLSVGLTELFGLMELCDKFEWASVENLSDLAFAD